jgi:hypothetical protein
VVLGGCGMIYYSGPYASVVKLSGFLLLGFVFATAMQKRATDANHRFPGSVVIAVCIQFVFIAFSFLIKKFESFANLSYFAAFFLPLVVSQAWQFFVAIPRHEPRLWFYSNDLPAKPQFVYLENRKVRIKIKSPNDRPFLISSDAPVQSKLGTTFYYMVSEHNKGGRSPVPFVKDNGQPQGWLFYTSLLGFRKKYLDPDESIYENNIRSNDLIVAERIL